jgi:hypothetical protein
MTGLDRDTRRSEQAASSGRPVRVFVSYAHDSERHKSQVLAFCELLRRNGIDADLDQWNTGQRQNWYAWMITQVTDADYVIIVASPGYKRIGDGSAARDDHPGVQSEAGLLQELLHADRPTWTPKLLPVVLPGSSVDHIPLFLQPRIADHFVVNELTRNGVEELLGVLTGQPSAERPPVGNVPSLPPRPPTHRPAVGDASQAASPNPMPPGAADTAVGTAAEVLAQQVGIQWLREEERSEVLAHAMPVRWAVTRTAETAMYGVTWESVEVTAPQDLAGRFDDIADLVAGQLPYRRLAILGDSGAGKTALAIRLVCDMIRGRLPGQRVPVLLTMGSWNPTEQRLPDWIVERLAQDHPFLRTRIQAAAGQKASLASLLVDSGWILPVLEGLDMIAEGMRADAITAINSLGPDVPLVVTSLTEPYGKAVQAADRGLSQTAVVELLPLTLAEARDYLAPNGRVGRWQRVFAHMEDKPNGPLAQALRTPLMLWLARTAYARSADPSELCDQTRFPDRAAVEDCLVDNLLHAVYPEQPTPATRRRTDEHWTHDDARSWLTTLARHLTDAGTDDIAWWLLHRAVPGFGLVWGFFSLFLFGLLIGLAWGVAVGVGLGLVLGLLGTNQRMLGLLSATPTDAPYRLLASPRRLRGTARRVLVDVASIVTPFTAGFVLLNLSAQHLAFTVAGWILWLIGFAVLAWIGRRRRRHDPTRELVVSTNPSSAATPESALRADRGSTLVPAVMVVLPGALATMLLRHPYGILFGLAFAAGWTMFGAWTRYTAARVILASRRRLPWRTMTFLRDAADRGALRQVGAVYQFRHPRLRDRLASAAVEHTDTPVRVDDS